MTTNKTSLPKVSILIPVYNRATLIRECIQSALAQTYQDFEIVIADNASDDGTWKICQQYAAQDSRIRVFRNDINVGPVRNWLRCVDEAHGEYGKILFSDDLISPQFLESTVPGILNPEIGFVFSAVKVGREPDNAIVQYQYQKQSGDISASKFTTDSLLDEGKLPVSPGAALFRLNDMKKCLITDIASPSFDDFDKHGAGPDLLLYLLVARAYPLVGYVREPLAFFRIHPGSISVEGANTIMHSRYFQAKIWFSKESYGESPLLRRLICKAWLDQSFGEKKILSIDSVRARYLEMPLRIGLVEKIIYVGIETAMRAMAALRYRLAGW